jgi:hypothetical protein
MTALESSTLEQLITRLAAGEAIEPERIPPELRQLPQVQHLLKLARVLGQLDANAASDPLASMPDLKAPERLGPFRLERLLGAGGMGEVWLGLRDDGQAEQRVAVKRVRAGLPGFAERLRSERRILARLEHPNIARFIDAGVDAAGSPWLALEYVDGLTITDWCAPRGLRERLQLFRKVCDAVDHAHRQLVMHRDLKPANVLVDARGEPKLLDFGIARLLDDSQAEATSSSLTPAYAAPEQLRGQVPGIASDVYALGLLLFRLLAGQLPASRRSGQLVAVLEQFEQEERVRPSAEAVADLPYPAAALRGDLDAIVAQALRADPARRYRSARELGEDIERHLSARPVRARPPSRRYRLGRFLRRNALASGFAAVAVLALLGGSLLALEQARRATRAAEQAAAQAQAAQVAQARAERSQRLLVGLFAGASPELHGGRMPSARDLLEQGGQELAQAGLSAADATELAATLAESWLALGDTTRAAEVLARVEAEVEPHPRTRARLALAAGRIDQNAGRLDAARAQFEAAAKAARQAGEPAALEASQALLGLANLDLFAGDYAGSLARSREAHEDRLRRYGEEDRASLDSGVALAVALIANDRLDASIEQFHITLRAAEARLGQPNAVACRAGNSLSDAYERRGDYAQALEAGEQALAACRAVFGESHPLYGQAELNVGFALGRLGRSSEAIAHYRRARSAYAESGHFDEGSALRYAAGALLGLERWEEAETALREAEAVLAAALGEDAELVLAARLNRASALSGLGRDAAAAELAEATLVAVEARFPPANSTRRNGLRVLAAIRRAQRRHEEALALQQQLVDVELKASGEASVPLALARQQLARTHALRARSEDLASATALLDASAAVLDQPGRSPLQRALLHLDRAELRQRQGLDPEAAESLQAASLALEGVAEPPPSALARLRALQR